MTVETRGEASRAGTDLHGSAAAHRAGGLARQLDPSAARRFAVSPSAAIKLMQRVHRQRRPGSLRRPSPATARPHEADLRRLVAATPDLMLVELQASLQHRCRLRAGLSTIHKALRRIGLRHKKVLR
jgi:hypothetical protein